MQSVSIPVRACKDSADIPKAVSSKKVAIEEDDEEAELRKLQAEMAM